jgi:hypothetical protein
MDNPSPKGLAFTHVMPTLRFKAILGMTRKNHSFSSATSATKQHGAWLEPNASTIMNF